MISIGPLGRIVTGSVLDVSLKPFERALKDYDPLLYVRWNPKKNSGNGVWEIRRRPEKKSVTETLLFEGNTYSVLSYKESSLVNHILDTPALNYSILTKLQAMDTWATHKNKGENWAADLHYSDLKTSEKEDLKKKQAVQYAARYFKAEINALREHILSGFNPHRLADFWGKVGQLS